LVNYLEFDSIYHLNHFFYKLIWCERKKR